MNYIEFYPALPSSVCSGETMDVTVRGKTTYSPTVAEFSTCTINDELSVFHCIDIMEADSLSGDDTIAHVCDYATSYYPCAELYFEHTFYNVDFYSEFGGVEDQGTIEVYAAVSDYDTGDGTGIVSYMSTSEYDIDKGNCGCPQGSDCSSGPCCDISSCLYKSNGAQPTDYTDSYFCDGANSATGTNYVKHTDYYCNGNDADVHSTTSTVDTCGICSYCQEGPSSCSDYSSSTTCGNTDCDYLDTTCRNYHDVDKYCSGSGSCSSATCNSYTNAAQGTSCGSGMECDGNGNCGTCDTHSYLSCSEGDVYWYDSCNSREDKKEECEDDYCGSFTGNYYCNGNDLRKWRWCFDKGCSSGSCYNNAWKDDILEETCSNGCEADSVQGAHCTEYCDVDSDCGSEYRYNAHCGSDGHVYMTYSVPHCAPQHYCYRLEEDRLVQSCRFGCTDGDCNPPDCTDQCSSGQKRCNGDYSQTCGNYDANVCREWPSSTSGDGNEYCTYGCYDYNGECFGEIACTLNRDCGWIDWMYTPVCLNGDVWQNGYTTHICENPGTTEATCVTISSTLKYMKKQECGEDYDTYSDDYCYNGNVVYDTTWHNHGCTTAGDPHCYSTTTEIPRVIKKECIDGCINGQCVEDICADECNSWETRCNGNYKQSCGDYDGQDDCIEWPLSTSGAGNEYCSNGCQNGGCIVCTTHNSFSCYNNDVYWYDSCNNREGIKEDCGTHRCSSGVCYGDFDFELHKGWNLFSLPVNYNKLSIFLDLIKNKMINLLIFNSTSDKWKIYNNNTNFNSIQIPEEYGMWLNLNDDDLWSYSAELSDGLTYNLKQGLNLISYFGVDEETITHVFGNVMSDINKIYAYENGEWKTYIPERSTNSLTTVKPGIGIWVNVKSDCVWNFKARDDNYFEKVS